MAVALSTVTWPQRHVYPPQSLRKRLNLQRLSLRGKCSAEDSNGSGSTRAEDTLSLRATDDSNPATMEEQRDEVQLQVDSAAVPAFWSSVPGVEGTAPRATLSQLTSPQYALPIFRLVLFACLQLAVSLPSWASSSPSSAASVATSPLGRKVASALRASGCPDPLTVALIASLPILELRGAILVALWMGMRPAKAALLAIVGNMLPVPLLLLLLPVLSARLAASSSAAKRALDFLLEHSRAKAGPVAEHRWLGLALFVGVPLPGTGAWSGAIVAHCLGMPVEEALSANLAGVCLAAAFVLLLCLLPFRQALALGVGLLVLSSCTWTLLRAVKGVLGGKGEEV